MDNLDSYIYIILTIVVIAISALRKKNKPTKRNVTGTEKRGIDNIFDLINQQYIVQDTSYNENVIEEKPIPKAQTPTPKVVDVKEKIVENKKMDDIQIESIKEIVDNEDNEWSDFDLKEAVIYAEILNRKTF